MKGRRILLTAVLIGFTMALPTGATTILGTVNIDNHNNNLSDQGTVWGGGLSGLTGYTGVYSWTNEGGTGLGTQVPNWGICIELSQGTYSGWQNVIPLDEAPLPPEYGTPMGTTKANYIRELWGRFFDPSWITGANTQMAEAFNCCLWEIIYESDPVWDVTSGTGFYATGIEDWATANSWLSQLNGNPAYFASNLVATSTIDGQDFLVQIPEPATICLLVIGGLLICRKKK